MSALAMGFVTKFRFADKQTHRDITKRVKKKLQMDFDHVLHDETTNEDVFNKCTKPLVHSVMDGYNCSVFVYGATGAGKTFTMLGSENNPGRETRPLSILFACLLESF